MIGWERKRRREGKEREGERDNSRREKEVEVVAVHEGFPSTSVIEAPLDYITCGRVATTLRMHRGVCGSLDSKKLTSPFFPPPAGRRVDSLPRA